jgi:hypothetical protein
MDGGIIGSFDYYDDDQKRMYQDEIDKNTKILNGEFEDMDEVVVSDFISTIAAYAENRRAPICLFNTKEKRDRVVRALGLIDAWYANPTDENREAMEDMYFSEELTPAEVEQMYDWLWFERRFYDITITIDGRVYDVSEYLGVYNARYGTTWGKRDIAAIEELKILNNTPNSEKNWMQPAPVPRILTEQELSQLAAMSEAEELAFYWENYNDESAALQLKAMYDAGEITDSVFCGDMVGFAATCSQLKADAYRLAADAVNGRALGGVDGEEKWKAWGSLDAFLSFGRLPVSLFETKEQRARVLYGINVINTWYQDPNDENGETLEAMLTSEDLAPGEFLFLYKYALQWLDYVSGDEDYYYSVQDFEWDFLYGPRGQTPLGKLLDEMYLEYLGIERLYAG